MRIVATIAAGLLLGSSWTVAVADEPAAPVAASPASECLCVLPIGAGPVVASLEEIEGQVLVADTKGYRHMQSRADLGVGDRVIMLGGSHAMLTGGATCRAQLGSGSMISVVAQKSKSACILRDVRVSPAADLPAPIDEVVYEEDDDDFLPFWWLGVAGAGGGFAALILTRDRDRDRPVSP